MMVRMQKTLLAIGLVCFMIIASIAGMYLVNEHTRQRLKIAETKPVAEEFVRSLQSGDLEKASSMIESCHVGTNCEGLRNDDIASNTQHELENLVAARPLPLDAIILAPAEGQTLELTPHADSTEFTGTVGDVPFSLAISQRKIVMFKFASICWKADNLSCEKHLNI